MKIIRNITVMTEAVRKQRQKGRSIGFVPTMGALHEGHLSLIRQARRENDFIVVSIFVNPTQFGPKDDFEKYPRNLKKDTMLCKKEKVDIIFYPNAKEIYPPEFKTYVEVKELSERLCGKSRPGHFKGVATVVTKLFNIVQPDSAYFGQKDAQQSVIINKLAQDLNMAIKIKVMPTLREKDGLAMSSRNAYISPQERKDAAILFRSLKSAKDLISKGEKNSRKIISNMRGLIKSKKSAKIDYIDIVDAKTLKFIDKITDNCLIVLAVWIGKTRLIDNIRD